MTDDGFEAAALLFERRAELGELRGVDPYGGRSYHRHDGEWCYLTLTRDGQPDLVHALGGFCINDI